jgi:hypothetical protein
MAVAWRFFVRALTRLWTALVRGIGKVWAAIVEATRAGYREFLPALTDVFYGCWFAKKYLQSRKRTHLSHVLAASLAGLLILQEWHRLLSALFYVVAISVAVMSRNYSELFTLSLGINWPTVGETLFVAVTVATFWEALWELFGNKLTTSPQETSFQYGMKQMLEGLQRLAFSRDDGIDMQTKLENFIESFLQVTANTFSVKSKAEAGLMMKHPDTETLELRKASKGANYPDELTIPLPDGADVSKSGPAGVAFANRHVAYVPKKERKIVWRFHRSETESADTLLPASWVPEKCWVPAESPVGCFRPDLEDFHSILCVPIGIYLNDSEKEPFGVLNVSTKARDPFVRRDFFMAECYAEILSHALALARREIQKQG